MFTHTDLRTPILQFLNMNAVVTMQTVLYLQQGISLLLVTCIYSSYMTNTIYSTEGHHSYEENGKASSFITLFVEALREGGKFRNMFDKVQESMYNISTRNRSLSIYSIIQCLLYYKNIGMKKNYVSVGGCTFAKPTVVHSGMDLHITFQDDIMVDSNGIEEVLDRLEDKWRSVNSENHYVYTMLHISSCCYILHCSST